MIRDPTRRVIERLHELTGDRAKHEDFVKANDDPNVAQVNDDKDIGMIIAEIRPTLLNATEAARKLNPSRAICLSWVLDNLHVLNANKLYVLKEVMSLLLETEEQG
jgi:hypothetical protein